MKKLFIFLAVALAFIMLSSTFLSIGKIFDKDPEETEDSGFVTVPGTTSPVTEPVQEEILFYTSDGSSYKEDQLCTLENATYVYYTENGITRFARVFTNCGGANSIDFVYRPDVIPEYSDSYCYKFLLDDGSYCDCEHFDLASVPEDAYGIGIGAYDKDHDRVVAVFLELSDCSDPQNVLLKFEGNVDFCPYAFYRS